MDGVIMIPTWVFKLGLEPIEVIVYAIILGFCQDGDSCYMACYRTSTEYLSNVLRITEDEARSIIDGLIKKDFIEEDNDFNEESSPCYWAKVWGSNIVQKGEVK